MTKIIALVNQKGGVGKTTSTINLAHALVKRGKRVLMIDMDPQASLTIYAGQDPSELEAEQKTLYHGLLDEERPLAELVIPGNPALLPSSISLANAEARLLQDWDSISFLKDKLRPIREDYDFILVDCPPTLTLLTVNALTAATSIIIPVKTDHLSIMGIPSLLETVEKLRRRKNPDLTIIGVLPTMFNVRNTHDNERLAELREVLGERIKVFDPVHRSTAFDKSAAEAQPTLLLSPTTPGIESYNEIAEHIING